MRWSPWDGSDVSGHLKDEWKEGNESWAFQLGRAEHVKTLMRKSMANLRNIRESNWSVKILDIFAYIILSLLKMCWIYLNTLWILHFSAYYSLCHRLCLLAHIIEILLCDVKWQHNYLCNHNLIINHSPIIEHIVSNFFLL